LRFARWRQCTKPGVRPAAPAAQNRAVIANPEPSGARAAASGSAPAAPPLPPPLAPADLPAAAAPPPPAPAKVAPVLVRPLTPALTAPPLHPPWRFPMAAQATAPWLPIYGCTFSEAMKGESGSTRLRS
jgi:2-oxoglutarate dehydrogenase E1 component